MTIQLVVSFVLVWVNLGNMVASFITDISNDRKLYEQSGTRLSSWHYLNILLRTLSTIIGVTIGYFIMINFNLTYSLGDFAITLLSIFYVSFVIKLLYMFTVSLVLANLAKKGQQSTTTSIDIDNT